MGLFTGFVDNKLNQKKQTYPFNDRMFLFFSCYNMDQSHQSLKQLLQQSENKVQVDACRIMMEHQLLLNQRSQQRGCGRKCKTL